MGIIIVILIGCIAGFHLYFMYFEMFTWTTTGKRIFRKFPSEYFESTKVLAANQGIYNGFLAAGLLWSLVIGNPEWSRNVALFFLTCVSIAGIFGALIASKKIFYVQALPAMIAIALLLVSNM